MLRLQSFQQLRQDIGDSIPWPDPVFFETNFSLHRDPHWIVIEIKELVTIPLEFAEKENAFEMTQAAALVRMAAWDHYFFENRKVGSENSPNLFCNLEKGETPADKFLFPSRTVANLKGLECLWKPLSEKRILEEYFTWVLSNFSNPKLATKTVPEYLVKNKFIENLSLPDLPPKLSRISRRQTAFTRKSIVSIIDKLCPEFLKRMSHYS
ncbi:hypothetical protein GE061_012974 [Apolygus lucorum]|uniref:Uncharacterized protein n=1 Tax=Apolygus lucorum TaxID=248454 RepID=A0A8S9XVV9_APOLU|nr:hypothetical protein GE061_012974 [Apolygus lucorum]